MPPLLSVAWPVALWTGQVAGNTGKGICPWCSGVHSHPPRCLVHSSVRFPYCPAWGSHTRLALLGYSTSGPSVHIHLQHECQPLGQLMTADSRSVHSLDITRHRCQDAGVAAAISVPPPEGAGPFPQSPSIPGN